MSNCGLFSSISPARLCISADVAKRLWGSVDSLSFSLASSGSAITRGACRIRGHAFSFQWISNCVEWLGSNVVKI